jgi:hypothetical protein
MLARLDVRLATIEASQGAANNNDMPPFGHDHHCNFNRGPRGGQCRLDDPRQLGTRMTGQYKDRSPHF